MEVFRIIGIFQGRAVKINKGMAHSASKLWPSVLLLSSNENWGKFQQALQYDFTASMRSTLVECKELINKTTPDFASLDIENPLVKFRYDNLVPNKVGDVESLNQE